MAVTTRWIICAECASKILSLIEILHKRINQLNQLQCMCIYCGLMGLYRWIYVFRWWYECNIVGLDDIMSVDSCAVWDHRCKSMWFDQGRVFMLDSHYICGIAMLRWHHNVELRCLDDISMCELLCSMMLLLIWMAALNGKHTMFEFVWVDVIIVRHRWPLYACIFVWFTSWMQKCWGFIMHVNCCS